MIGADSVPPVSPASEGNTSTGAGRSRSVVHWLVVGMGDVALRRVLPALQREPRSVIHGVVSRDPAKGAKHAPRVWTDLQDALQDEVIDAVYLATPVFLHHAQALQALRAGKHVLCEKPITISWAEACELEHVAHRENRLLGVAYFRRHYPKLVEARKLLGQGVIGTPVMAFASCSEWVPEFTAERSWLLDSSRAGSGPLYDIGSHRIDALNFLLGDPVRVAAQMNTAVRPFPVEDGATVLIEYSSGARAVVDARWNTRTAMNEFRIVGTDGILELGPLDSPWLLYGDRKQHLPCDENRHFPCIEAFVEGILDGKPLECSAARVRGAARVLDAASKEWREALRTTAPAARAHSTANLGST